MQEPVPCDFTRPQPDKKESTIGPSFGQGKQGRGRPLHNPRSRFTTDRRMRILEEK